MKPNKLLTFLIVAVGLLILPLLLQNGGNDVVVRTADDAKSVAGIALQRDISIPPTVKVAQGTAIRIFIARDLDFSGTDGGV